jgi:hypothetical protein
MLGWGRPKRREQATRGHVANLDLLQDSQETVIMLSAVVEDSDDRLGQELIAPALGNIVK